MRTRALLLLAAATGALALPLLATSMTRAEEETVVSDGGVDSGPEDGGADADAGPSPLPSYRLEPFSEDRSPEPKANEWSSAPRVSIDRSSWTVATTDAPTSGRCDARRVREWVRIRCNLIISAITLLGGDREGLAMRLDPTPQQEWTTFPEGAEVVFPVRRGDRRVIEWLGVAFGYHGMSALEPAFVLSEQWAPGDPGPLLVVE